MSEENSSVEVVPEASSQTSLSDRKHVINLFVKVRACRDEFMCVLNCPRCRANQNGISTKPSHVLMACNRKLHAESYNVTRRMVCVCSDRSNGCTHLPFMNATISLP